MSNDSIAQTYNSLLSNITESALTFTPTALPSSVNGNIAIVQCKLHRNRTTISNFGVASAQELGSENQKDILDAARVDSLKNVIEIARSLLMEVDIDYFSVHQPSKQLPSSDNDKSKFQGGGCKPISQSQIKFIMGLCTKQRENFDDVAKRICGKDTSELTGADANAIIADLK